MCSIPWRISRHLSHRSAGALLFAAACLNACVAPPSEPTAPVAIEAPPPPVAQSCTPSFSETGVASWYGEAFHLRQTASGEPFDMDDLTAAHRWLALNTVVRVTNLRNGRSVVLRINDRGPYVRGRTIDVSRYAAKQLGMKSTGVVPVRIEVFDLDKHPGRNRPVLAASNSAAPKAVAGIAGSSSPSIPETRASIPASHP
jgi:rare lipoprotein A (peptidoglycan hydrolase)